MSLQVPSTALPNGQSPGADLTNSNVTITVAQGRFRARFDGANWILKSFGVQ
jgi:hypothetical protein